MAERAIRNLRLAKNNSMLLASQTVHVTSDAKAKPSITVCTTMSAEANIDHGERSRGRWPTPTIPGDGSGAGGTAEGGACGISMGGCAPGTRPGADAVFPVGGGSADGFGA